MHLLIELAARLGATVGVPELPDAIRDLADRRGGRLGATARQLLRADDDRAPDREQAAVQALAALVARADAGAGGQRSRADGNCGTWEGSAARIWRSCSATARDWLSWLALGWSIHQPGPQRRTLPYKGRLSPASKPPPRAAPSGAAGRSPSPHGSCPGLARRNGRARRSSPQRAIRHRARTRRSRGLCGLQPGWQVPASPQPR